MHSIFRRLCVFFCDFFLCLTFFTSIISISPLLSMYFYIFLLLYLAISAMFVCVFFNDFFAFNPCSRQKRWERENCCRGSDWAGSRADRGGLAKEEWAKGRESGRGSPWGSPWDARRGGHPRWACPAFRRWWSYLRRRKE